MQVMDCDVYKILNPADSSAKSTKEVNIASKSGSFSTEGKTYGSRLNESLAREATQTLNLSVLSHICLVLSATKKKVQEN